VAKLNDRKMLSPLSRGSWVHITLDNKRNIVELILSQTSLPETSSSFRINNEPYQPTVVTGAGLAKKYFNESRISRGDTQCFNRAHVWSFELWKKHQVKSQKVFLFFTLKFIREHNYGWWFHVAPLLIVDEWSGKKEKVIDPRYITAPRSIDWWVDKFVSNGSCPVVPRYSEYADFPYIGECYIMKAPMFIHQPLDLQMQEVWDVQKNEFTHDDITWSYKEAFQMDYSGERR
jgi:hypothetical protein